jgi:3-oxoacyl-[acyl-carrier protein] reductase
MDMKLEGRVAIVGGASQGMGRKTAVLLAQEGCHVAMAARGERALAQAAMLVRGFGHGGPQTSEVLPVPCDMSKADDITRLVAQTVERFGRIDILVNNAGGPPLGRFEQHDDAAWQQAFEQNFMSVVRMVREALPYLKESDQARVINITSTAVKEPIDGLILSNAVRMGTTGLAKTLSRELGPLGITVNNVAPGATMTDRSRALIEAQAQAQRRTFDEVRAERAAAIPTRRIGEPEDVAAMIVFLASAHGRQVNGQTILVDGGAVGASL